MSEYQYYEFTAVDRPLSAREQAELRSLSTRADITATSFVNTYEWGNFKGDPRKLMEKYFDAHLYRTNWGTREIMLRLPKRVLDPAVAADYCVSDSASAWTSGKYVIVRLNREDEDGTDEFDIDGHGVLASIIPVRASLAAGDLRLLYLSWLRCVQSQELADDEPEPPVPAGLGTLDASLTAVAEFLCIDPDLLAAAAAGSSPARADEPTGARLRTWVRGLPAQDKDKILGNLITGDGIHLRSQLLRRYRDAHPTAASTTATPRNAGELLATAAGLRTAREHRDAEQRNRERVRRERSAAAARQRHLDALAVDQPATWQRVDKLIDTKKPREYDTAVQLLIDLRSPNATATPPRSSTGWPNYGRRTPASPACSNASTLPAWIPEHIRATTTRPLCCTSIRPVGGGAARGHRGVTRSGLRVTCGRGGFTTTSPLGSANIDVPALGTR